MLQPPAGPGTTGADAGAPGAADATAGFLSDLAEQEAWVRANMDWTDAHAKLNTFRNGAYDDPVKDHLTYTETPEGRPFDLWPEGG